MCFFKAPSVTMPTVSDTPTIQETKAPEPAAPVFGGGDASGAGEVAGEVAGATKKTGVSSLKVKPSMAPAATGANLALKPNM